VLKKTDIRQLNLPHGTKLKKWKTEKPKQNFKNRICCEVSVNSLEIRGVCPEEQCISSIDGCHQSLINRLKSISSHSASAIYCNNCECLYCQMQLANDLNRTTNDRPQHTVVVINLTRYSTFIYNENTQNYFLRMSRHLL